MFDENEHYTDVAVELDREASNFFRGLFNRYVAKGCKVREIESVLVAALTLESCSAILSKDHESVT